MKRAFDVVMAALGLVVLAPVLVVIALAVWLSSPGPPLFRQLRAGRFGEPFRMWKFRTMTVGAESARPELLAQSRDPDWLSLENDPRVTRVGRFLRRTSLDELPQLLNVLHGEMSLVGPRPLPLAEHARAPEWSAPRLRVRPGLTGLWQVTGRTRTSFLEMLRIDCRYASRRSFWADLKILVQTVPAVLRGRGAN